VAGIPDVEATWAARRERTVVQSPRADRIIVTQPVVLSANKVQTKKKPPDLPTTFDDVRPMTERHRH